MKAIALILFTLFVFEASGQETPTSLAAPIVEEGKRLYKSEMASWYGTDLFVEKYSDKSNIAGYFSYSDKDVAKCIFYSKGDNSKVIGTVAFDSSFDIKTARLDLTEREFTSLEFDLFIIRKKALTKINSDTFFKSYQNTSLNLIPLISEDVKKVYVLTGPKENGVVILGNDYLLTFDKDNNLETKKSLHKNIIVLNYSGNETDEKEIEGTIHSHLPETGDFITATDICTLMLYAKFAKWKQHNVVSKNYLNIWDCLKNELLVLPMSTIDKINKDQEKRKKNKSRNN